MTTPERTTRPPEKPNSEWMLDILEKLEDVQASIPISKKNDEHGQCIAAGLAAARKLVGAGDAVLLAASKSERLAKAVGLLQRLAVVLDRLPVEKRADVGRAIDQRQLAASIASGIEKAVAEMGRLKAENAALLKANGEAVHAMKRAVETRKSDAAELALLGQQMQKVLAMPIPGRAPIRNMHAAEQLLKSATPRETEVLRQAAVGAPPAVRDYLLNEANAIEKTR